MPPKRSELLATDSDSDSENAIDAPAYQHLWSEVLGQNRVDNPLVITLLLIITALTVLLYWSVWLVGFTLQYTLFEQQYRDATLRYIGCWLILFLLLLGSMGRFIILWIKASCC